MHTDPDPFADADLPAAEADDEPLSPEAMLALLVDQRRSIEGQIAGFVPAIVLAWGIAWFVGFGALWLIDGLEPDFSLPVPLAIVTFSVLLAAAIALSTFLGIRSGRGLRGDTRAAFQGAAYGITWSVGSVAIFGFAQGLFANGMDRDLANIFFPVAFVLFAGIMYVFAGVLWHAIPSLVIGVWTLAVGVAAPFFGYPNHYLVLALGGGLGFVALGVVSFAHLRRLRRATTPRGARRG